MSRPTTWALVQVVARRLAPIALVALALTLPAASALDARDLDISVSESVAVDLTNYLIGVRVDSPPDVLEEALGDALPTPSVPLPEEAPTVPPHVALRLERAIPLASADAAIEIPSDPVVLVTASLPATPPALVRERDPDLPLPAPVLAVSVVGSAAFSTFLSPPLLGRFFTRLERGAALENPVRRRVYEAIETEPGLSPTDLRVRVGLGNGALLHHLDVLRREGLVTRVEAGRFVRLFVTGRHSPNEMRAHALTLQGTPRRLLALVRERPGVPVREAAREIGLSVPATHRTARQLEDARLVERRREGRGHSIYPSSEAPILA